ncbi:Permease of the drug/metabolite transporter (DMT) superfamily [Halogranum gelatinilyticum]|uniref:Permease of the drug/metabolite transporter (DMT) superfamily n=1 Tax=Halogranum gelatinilyticum TaxID=660521 RepID=A0A1G9XY98_9EURY|nr:EamA family transporter [Halogranum gelatinilyticum]SDN01792.1 Permease of the drug/metabolite transporter (DMT) superfamily [Halogranum gelatinilyticum]
MSSRGTLTLFGAASVCLGTSFVAIKVGLATVPPVLFAAFRFDIAAVLLLALAAYLYDDWLPQTRRDLLGIAASAVFIVGINNALLFVGQQYTTSGAAAIMYSLMPVVSPVFTYLLLGERVARLDVAGILLGLVGVMVIVQPSPDQLGVGTVGQLLVLVAAVSVSLGSVLLQRARPRLAMLPLSAWAMLLGALGLHATSLAIGESAATIPLTADTVAAVIYVGAPGTAIAYGAYFLLIADAGPVRANLVAYAVPAVATVTAWALLGEALATTTLAGFGIILAGFALLQRTQLRAEVDRFLHTAEQDVRAFERESDD